MKSTSWRLSARNALRRPVRTGLTTGMVVLGVALLLVGLTWIRGVMGGSLVTATSMAGHVRVVDPDFALKEELSPLDQNVPHATALAETLRQQPGVVAVEPRITVGVTVTAGEEIGDVFAQAIGANESYFRERLRAKEKLVQGAWFTGAPDELIAGSKVVSELGAKVGDELLLLGRTQDGSMSPIKGKLVGVVHGGGTFDRQLFVPLQKLQWLADIDEGATEVLVYGARFEDGKTLAASLSPLPELQGYAVQPWSTRDPWKGLAEQARRTQSIIIFVVVLLTAIGIWNTMMMSVLERTHEVGVLRALGLSRGRTVLLFVGEALAIGVAGGLLGIALGAVPAWLLEKNGLHIGEQTASSMQGVAEHVYGDFSLDAVVTAFSLGLLMAVLGSLLPALRAASIQPVSAMRSGR